MYERKGINNNALIVFAVNPVINIGESRLAEKYQDKEALKAYLNCLKNVYKQTKNLNSKKFLFLDMAFNQKQHDSGYQVCIQYGNDPSMKMYHAFEKIFDSGHSKAVILSADIPGIKQEIIEKAFEKLDTYDVVIGPTTKGGFYLIGTKQPTYMIFDDMLLNEKAVLESLIEKVNSMGKSYLLLEELSNSGSVDILNLGSTTTYYKELKSKGN